jgi:uncharacterized protein YceK
MGKRDMTRTFRILALTMSLAGCASVEQTGPNQGQPSWAISWAQNVTAGQIGCRPVEIQIEDLVFGDAHADPISWKAACKNREMWCSSAHDNVSCAPEAH